jgi:superfamily II DNA or RNA helicase
VRLTLRPYQVEALERVNAAAGRGVRRQLGVAATGLGKTVMFCALAERMGCRTLILAHRDELIAQAAAKVREVWPDAPSIGVVQGPSNEAAAHVVVASVQTVSRPNRLARLCPPHSGPLSLSDGPSAAMLDVGWADPFGLVVVDEAHHTAAQTYRRVLDHLGAGLENGPLLLGVTATPDRGDGKGLDDLFDEITFSYDILWGIRSGYLCDLRGVAIKLDDLRVQDIAVSRGDYQAGAAGDALLDAGAPDAIAEGWLAHAAGRRTLVFTPTVETALLTAAAFRHRGVAAESVSGDMPMEDRRLILKRFDRGDIDVVVNCMVLTEGYDAPRVDCIVVARPTRSRALYTQMVGRGTRRHPDKTDCLVLDVVGAAAEHSLVTVPSLFGEDVRLRARLEDEDRPVSEVVAEYEAQEVEAGRLRAEDLELFAQVRRELAWVEARRAGDPRRRYALTIGPGQVLVMMQRDPDDDGSWAVQCQYRPQKDGRVKPPYGWSPDEVVRGFRPLWRDGTLELVEGVAEDYARRFGRSYLTNLNAAWRAKPPSAKAKAAAKKWGLDPSRYRTAGELSDAMSARIHRVKAPR